MKCPNCGAPLTMEEKFCSYCGAPNTLAQQHQKEMAHFEQEYARTRNDVVASSRRAGSFAGMLAAVLIMFALVVAAGILCTRTWDIRYAREKAQANERTPAYRAAVEAMIADQDYVSLSNYYYPSGMSRSDKLEEYSAVVHYAGYLGTLYQYLCDTDEYSYRSRGLAENANYMADALISLYEDPKDAYFDGESVTEDKLAVIEDIRRQAEAILVAYAGFTPEEAVGVRDMSKSRVEELLTGRLETIDAEREAALKAAAGKTSAEEALREGMGGEDK